LKFLIIEIFVYLAVAAGLGVVLGFALGRIFAARQMEEITDNLTRTRRALHDMQVRAVDAEKTLQNSRANKHPDGTDDLTRIRGIAHVLEKRLNDLGITTFERISKLTSEEVAEINKALRFKGRIEREQWIEQARELARQQSL
jgi:predicted flap endonuclease-1-like 5' DNA nuclease